MPDSTARQPALDLFGEVLFDCFPDGRRVLGGAPFNVAWHLRAFGAAPRLISAVGADPEGDAIRRAMSAWGMDPGGLQIHPDCATGEVRVTLEAGEPSYEIIPDRAFDRIRAVVPPTPAGGLLYHGTLALRHPVSAATFEALVTGGYRVRFIDVNLRDPWWSMQRTRDLVRGANWAKLNRRELVRLSDDRAAGADGIPDAELGKLATDFLERYALTGLVVTLGGDGAFAVARDTAPVRVAPKSVAAVNDTVGAGDAFAAVVLLGITRGWALDTTLERATDFASRIVEQPGATTMDPTLYRPYREHWGLSDASTPSAPPGRCPEGDSATGS